MRMVVGTEGSGLRTSRSDVGPRTDQLNNHKKVYIKKQVRQVTVRDAQSPVSGLFARSERVLLFRLQMVSRHSGSIPSVQD